ncbi:MAG: transporter [Lutibacter sp.]
MVISKNIILVSFLVLIPKAFSQEIITDRPDQTESSVTVGKNNFQIESGVLYQKIDNSNSFIGPSTLLRYGITNGIELRFVSQYETTKIGLDVGDIKYSGFNDLEFGAKIQLFKKEDVSTEMAFLSHVIIPTADENLTSNHVGVVNKLSISHAITDKIGLGYNIGYDYVGQQSSLTYSFALGFQLSNSIGFYIEPYGEWGESNNYKSNFGVGFSYLVNGNFQLDASYGVGLNNNMQYISTGFSWRIQNFLAKKKA